MKTNKSVFKRTCICIIFLFFSHLLWSENSTNWVIAATKFNYAKGFEKTAVSEGSAEMFPVSILEKLSKTLERNVFPDENYERQSYKLRTERQSLFLQLTSEYQKRDSLLLQNYTSRQLQAKLKEENKLISDIHRKINENLSKQRDYEAETEKNMVKLSSMSLDTDESKNNEWQLMKSFFKNIFSKEESIVTQESITLFHNDFTSLYSPSSQLQEAGYESSVFEKEMVNSKINNLITGTIAGYGDYISVSVDLYLYPGSRKIGSAMEIGTLQDSDLIISSLVNQIIPFITNSIPLEVQLQINPPEAAKKTQIYLDDVLQTSIDTTLHMESGVHTIKFVSDGYKSTGTTYHFSANTKYQIEINYEQAVNNVMQITLKNPMEGQFLANGISGINISPEKSQISINGKKVLGEFINSAGDTAFFYIPENLVFNESVVKLNPKAYDRGKYIDSRRKWMYSSYSLFIISLIPSFYTYGRLVNEAKLYKEDMVSYEDALKYQQASNITRGISIGCGALFIYELIRYIAATSSVLPQKAQAGDLAEFEVCQTETDTEETTDSPSDDIIENTEMKHTE